MCIRDRSNVVPQTRNNNLLNMFALFKTYNPDTTTIIRFKRRNFKRQVRNIRQIFPYDCPYGVDLQSQFN